MRTVATRTWRVDTNDWRRRTVWRRAVDAGMTFDSWQTLGDWLEELVPWDYFVTLTFRRTVGRERAVAFAREWLRTIAKDRVDGHLFVTYGTEAHELGGHHVHLLVHVDQNRWSVDVDVLRRAWLASCNVAGPRSEFRAFESGVGAGFYVVKDGDWDFFVPCPRRRCCRRSAGCLGEARFTQVIKRQ